jgi:hypothetical protein
LIVKLLKLFTVLCPLEPQLPVKLGPSFATLLTTTKAKSVEFECIRCIIAVMPPDNEIVQTAFDHLKTGFLNSIDRNLRFLGLELVHEMLRVQESNVELVSTWVKDLHERVLESVEEADPTVRGVALSILDKIVTSENYPDVAKKLYEASDNAAVADAFIGTLLQMGHRNQYLLVDDFAWYLMLLTDIARHRPGNHVKEVGLQFVDISVRVPAVRKYAVALSCLLVSGGDPKAPTVVGAEAVLSCAWLVGEFCSELEPGSYLTAVKSLLNPMIAGTTSEEAAPAAVRAVCIWAAFKVYVGAATREAPDAIHGMQKLLMQALPQHERSTEIEVSERARLVKQFTEESNAQPENLTDFSSVAFSEELKPVRDDAQSLVPIPEGLDLETPFFDLPEGEDQNMREDMDGRHDYSLLPKSERQNASDFASREQSNGKAPTPKAPEQPAHSNLFRLSAPPKESPTEESSAPVDDDDPIRKMQQQLLKAGAEKKQYKVMRSEDAAPPGGAPSSEETPAAAAAAAVAPASANALPMPTQSVDTLEGKLWSVLFCDSALKIYGCIRGRQVIAGQPPQVRVDLRAENAAPTNGPLKTVAMLVEHSSGGVLLADEMQERSGKSKVFVNMKAQPEPVAWTLNCQLKYSCPDSAGEYSEKRAIFQLTIPASRGLT